MYRTPYFDIHAEGRYGRLIKLGASAAYVHNVKPILLNVPFTRLLEISSRFHFLSYIMKQQAKKNESTGSSISYLKTFELMITCIFQRALDNPVLPIDADDEMDEESEKLERAYVNVMTRLRDILHDSILELQEVRHYSLMSLLTSLGSYFVVAVHSAPTLHSFGVPLVQSREGFSTFSRRRYYPVLSK